MALNWFINTPVLDFKWPLREGVVGDGWKFASLLIGWAITLILAIITIIGIGLLIEWAMNWSNRERYD
jgi:hypothetical protein